jgi:hypothetical protein
MDPAHCKEMGIVTLKQGEKRIEAFLFERKHPFDRNFDRNQTAYA